MIYKKIVRITLLYIKKFNNIKGQIDSSLKYKF